MGKKMFFKLPLIDSRALHGNLNLENGVYSSYCSKISRDFFCSRGKRVSERR